MRRSTAGAFLAFALALPLLPGCSRPEGRSVILVTLDTTRADHLGVYGHPEARTPTLDRLAREGALVQFAVADVPVTLPSHTTMMTGVPALGHGVRFNADFKVGERAATLAETFLARGFDTAAIVSTLVLLEEFGIAQGFRHYDDDLTPGYRKVDESKYPRETHWLPKADRRADETMDRALEWLRRASAPYFLWLHFYDPHFPFDAPHPWDRTASHPYLAEIQFTDRELWRLIRHLDETGAPPGSGERAGSAGAGANDPVILVTADHGEGLDQHREDGHGIFVYDDTVRIPMILRARGAVAPGTIAAEQARTLDVPLTLLELAGLPDEELGIGESIVPLLTGGDPPDPLAYVESIKTRLFYGGTGLKGVRTKDAKYVWAPRPELYDLVNDPGETVNLAESSPELAARFRGALEDRVRGIVGLDLAFVEAANADEKTLEGLRSLGYLSGSDGGARPGSFDVEMALVGNDPKDLVDVSMGAREIQNGFLDRGEQKLLRFFRTARAPEDPRMARLWAAAHQNYAKIWMVRGDFRKAADEYGRALAVDPGYESALWSRIYALNLAGEYALAESEAASILRERPKAWRVRLHRGLALALLSRGEEARRELATVREGAPGNAGVTGNAAYFLGKLGSPEEEKALLAYLDSESRRSEPPPDSP